MIMRSTNFLINGDYYVALPEQPLTQKRTVFVVSVTILYIELHFFVQLFTVHRAKDYTYSTDLNVQLGA